MRPAGISVALVAAFVAGCVPGSEVQRRLSSPAGIRSQIEAYFLGVKDRFTEDHIDACLAERRKKGANYIAAGRTIYQPSYFFTCVANTDVGSQEFLEQPPGRYSIAYEVHVPVRPPQNSFGVKLKPGESWYYWARCDYAVEGAAIRLQQNSKADVFIGEGPPGLGRPIRHICMEMENADQLLNINRQSSDAVSTYITRVN